MTPKAQYRSLRMIPIHVQWGRPPTYIRATYMTPNDSKNDPANKEKAVREFTEQQCECTKGVNEKLFSAWPPCLGQCKELIAKRMVLAMLDVKRQTMTERSHGYDIEAVDVDDLIDAAHSEIEE